jgi:hypothetical protein
LFDHVGLATTSTARTLGYGLLIVVAVLLGRKLSTRGADRLARLLSTLFGMAGWTLTQVVVGTATSSVPPVLYSLAVLGAFTAAAEICHRRGRELAIPLLRLNGQPVTISIAPPSCYGLAFYTALSTSGSALLSHVGMPIASGTLSIAYAGVAAIAVSLGFFVRQRRADRTSRSFSSALGFSGAILTKLADDPMSLVSPVIICGILVALVTVAAEIGYRRHQPPHLVASATQP